MTSRSILVTGGAGFIGSELVAQLASGGHDVTVLDDLSAGRRENLAGLPRDRVRLVVGDVRDPGTIATVLRGVDLVFHLACVDLRRSFVAPREAHAVNAGTALELALAARRAGVARLVHVSSSEVYGSARHATIHEDHPTLPATVYGASKLAGEAYARAVGETTGLDVVVARPFNAYGPRSHHEGTSGEVVPRFVLRALAGKPLVVFGDGRQTRDFTHVADTARGLVLCGVSPAARGLTIQLGSGRETSVLELAERIAAATGRADLRVEHAPARPADLARQRADARRARELLGWEPRIGLDEGLRDLVAWMRGRDLSPERLLEAEVLRNWEAGAAAPETR